ncbi:hypothetical protein GCM10010233_65660 [Streptomyces pseudogriseolus]|nr:hypothetical protein GCM10010233_65660 [Streptomyces gancidicus]
MISTGTEILELKSVIFDKSASSKSFAGLSTSGSSGGGQMQGNDVMPVEIGDFGHILGGS